MKLAGFPEAQRNDGRVGRNVACLVCMEANVVVLGWCNTAGMVG